MNPEEKVKAERMKARIFGLMEGFEAGASVDVKEQEQRIAELEAENTELEKIVKNQAREIILLAGKAYPAIDAARKEGR